MSIFEEIKVGDKVVVDIPGWTERPVKIEEVTKVTATQFTAGGIRFKKSDGWQTPRVYEQARILTTWIPGKGERLVTPKEAEEKNKGFEDAKRRRTLGRQIAACNFSQLPYETLLKLAEILEIEVTDDNQT